LAAPSVPGLRSSPYNCYEVLISPINLALRDHERGTSDWPWAQLVCTLHEWTERFTFEFKLDVAVPVIQVEAIPFRTLGTYRRGRNGFALRDEITINARHVNRPLSRLLATLLHELLHQWQEVHGRPSKRNHHNNEFRKKARSLGLVVNSRGETHITPGPFTDLLKRYDLDVVASEATRVNPSPIALAPGSKLKKWSCGCTNVRCAVELAAVCAHCGEWFVRV
jgi:hypothetical protein